MKIKDIWYYIQGHFRYPLFYRICCGFLMRKHIREQIEYRIRVMNEDCYTQGSCVACGCKTTHLQMADKSCDKNCYFPMMSKEEWNNFKNTEEYAKNR